MTRVIEPRGGQLFSLVPDGFPEVAVSGATAWARLFIPGEPVPKGRHRSRVVRITKRFLVATRIAVG